MFTTAILQASLGAYAVFGIELAYTDAQGKAGALVDQGRPVVFFPDLAQATVSKVREEARRYLIEEGVL